MKDYMYDVFLSFTGADREYKDTIKHHLDGLGLSYYDSDLYCNGRFRDDYCEALDKSRVYLMILSDNLHNDPAVSGFGWLTEVRRESNLASDLEGANQLNIVILCMSEFFSFDKPFHDSNDIMGWHFYSMTRGFTRIKSVVDENGKLSEKTLDEIASHCCRFIERRNSGRPIPSQAPKLEIAIEKLLDKGIFKGRENEIDDAIEAFKNGNNIVVLSGIGGVGKTTLATEIARRCEQIGFMQCPQIVHIQELSGAGGGLHTIVSSVNFDKVVYDSLPSLTERERFERKVSALSSLPETILLVVDNYNNISEKDLKEILSRLKCRVLITTRAKLDKKRSDSISIIDIGCLKPEPAYEAFCEIYGKKIDEKDFDKLYKLVGGHTITLCIMAKILLVHRLSVSELLSQMGELDSFDAKVDFAHNEHGDPDTILGHLRKLFDISDFSDTCEQILRSMSILGDGTIKLSDLMHILKLKNRNEITELVSKGWLELQIKLVDNVECEFLYIHPILSRLVVSLLVPTDENVAEMINYIIAETDKAREWLTFADATVLEDKLYYACYVLAGGSQRLSRKLWDKFVDVNHLLGDVDSTVEKVKALTGRISDSEEKSIISTYADMVTIEQFPTRIGLVEKYLETLDTNARDYKFVLRSLSIMLPHIIKSEKHQPFLKRALTKAIDSAIKHKDDFALFDLTSYALFSFKGKDISKIIKPYIKARKKEGGITGALIFLEAYSNYLSLFTINGPEDVFKLLSSALNNLIDEKYGSWLKARILHPIATHRVLHAIISLEEMDDNDTFAHFYHLLLECIASLEDESKLDARRLIDATMHMHMHRLQEDTTLASANTAISGAIAMLQRLPPALIREGISEIVENIDMNNISVKSLSNLQVATLVNSAFGDKIAIEQSRHLIKLLRHLRPEGHTDIVTAIISHADICYTFGSLDESLENYKAALSIISESSDDSAKIAELAQKMLRINRISTASENELIEIRDLALSGLKNTDSSYYWVIYNYSRRVLEKISRNELSLDAPAYKEILSLIMEGVKNMRLLNVASQNVILDTIDTSCSLLINQKHYEHARDFRSLFEFFYKSSKKTIRNNAKIYYARCVFYEKYKQDSQNSIKLAKNVLKLCLKGKCLLSVACNTLWLISPLIITKSELKLDLLIKSKRTIENLRSIEKSDKSRLLNVLYSMRLRQEVLESRRQQLSILFARDLKLAFDMLKSNNMNISAKEFKKLKNVDDLIELAFKNALMVAHQNCIKTINRCF